MRLCPTDMSLLWSDIRLWVSSINISLLRAILVGGSCTECAFVSLDGGFAPS